VILLVTRRMRSLLKQRFSRAQPASAMTGFNTLPPGRLTQY